MFDPFGDYAVAGYLRNTLREKDLDSIKVMEHTLFRAQISEALNFIQSREIIEYADFLKVHHILFGALYPWAGKDRQEVAPSTGIRKGPVHFCDPADCRRAVEAGLRIGQSTQMASQFGFVMGYFAFGHPFLDGNGRTMLLVHAELCNRSGFSIDWSRTNKSAYLSALTAEIETPGNILNGYLSPFKSAPIPSDKWVQAVTELRGLDGANAPEDKAESYDTPGVREDYEAFVSRREQSIPKI